jgi:hypothetical protein
VGGSAFGHIYCVLAQLSSARCGPNSLRGPSSLPRYTTTTNGHRQAGLGCLSHTALALHAKFHWLVGPSCRIYPLQIPPTSVPIMVRIGRHVMPENSGNIALSRTSPWSISKDQGKPSSFTHRSTGFLSLWSRATVALPSMHSLTGTSWPRWVAHIGLPGPTRLQQVLCQTRGGGRRSRRNCSTGNSSAAGRLTSWPGNSMCRIPVRSRPPYSPSSPPHNGSVELKNGAWAWWTRNCGHGVAMRGVSCAAVPCVWGRCTWAVEIESKGSGRLWRGASVVVDQESSGSSAISVYLKSWP